MSNQQIGGPPIAAAGSPALARDRNLVAPIRTYANDIIGFAEMLEDPDISLSADRRREYQAILCASGAALAHHLRETFKADDAA